MSISIEETPFINLSFQTSVAFFSFSFPLFERSVRRTEIPNRVIQALKKFTCAGASLWRFQSLWKPVQDLMFSQTVWLHQTLQDPPCLIHIIKAKNLFIPQHYSNIWWKTNIPNFYKLHLCVGQNHQPQSDIVNHKTKTICGSEKTKIKYFLARTNKYSDLSARLLAVFPAYTMSQN